MATLTTSYQLLAQTYVGYTGYADVYLRLYAKYNSQSIADNSSSVSYKSTIYFGTGTFYTGNTTTKILEGSGATTVSQDGAATYYAGETTLNEITGTVWHNAEGKYTAWGKATFISTPWGWNVSAEATADLPTIPRYATSNQSLNSKTETTIKMNWSSDNTIDYLWYSTNNGSSWTGIDVTDGTSGTYTISGLSPNTTYTIKTRVRRKDSQLTTDSSALSVTTYKVPTNALSSREETTIKMTWSVDSTADYIWYSKDNGSTWTGIDVTDGTSGSYTISGLSANTTYKIKTRIRRKATQTTYDTAAVSVTTYNYPHITAVETANLTIGNSQKLTLYNPLSRKVTIRMYKDSTSGTQLYSGETSSTSITFTPTASTLYATIPSAKSGKCVYSAIYSSSTKTTTGSYTYVINEANCKPTFSNFAYADTDDSTKAITGNDKILINNNSNCLFHISTDNKAIAKNSATIVSYKCEWGSQSATGTYSETESVKVQINNSSGNTLKVTAIDSRGLSTTVTKTITAIAYTSAVVNSVEVQRLNGVDLETYLGLKMTIWKGNWQNGSDTTYDNQLKYVGYRVYDGSAWTSYFDITDTVKSNMSSSTSGSSTVITVPLSKKMAIHANGSSGGFTIGKSYTIQVLIKDGTSAATFTPYGYQATAQGTVPDGKVGFSRYKDSDGNYHYAINGMPIKNQNFAVHGSLYINGSGSSASNATGKLVFGNNGDTEVFISTNTNSGLYFNTSETDNTNQIGYDGANNAFRPSSSNTKAMLGSSGAPWYQMLAKDYIGTTDGNIWANTTTADKEIACGVQKKSGVNAGSVYFYTKGSTTGNRGIYTINNAGAGASVITITSSNGITFHGNASTATKASSADTATNSTRTDVTNTNPSSGTTYYPTFVTGAGTGAIIRANNGIQYYSIEGTASAVGRSLLTLGNQTASGTAGNKRGELKIFSEKSGCTRLHTATTQTGDYTAFLPQHGGYIYGATSLYNNTSGTTGTVTLSETAANFTYLEIFYGKGAEYLNSMKIYSPNDKRAALSISYYNNGSILTQTNTKQISISGTSITGVSGQSGWMNVISNSASTGSGNEMMIFRVIGWK